MPRIPRVVALYVMLTVCAGHAQQGATPAPQTPAAPAPARGVLGPAPNFTGNTTTLDTT